MKQVPEFVVDIEPGPGTGLRLCVSATGLAPIEDELERPPPSFPPAELDELRSGSASEGVAEDLAGLVSSWLLQNDLRGHLATAFNAALEPFRIVFRLHAKLLSGLADVPFELLKFDTDPLVLQRQVRAIVHIMKRSRAAQPMRASCAPTILLIRANPVDLGGQVPPILPLRDRIREIAAAGRGLDNVEVTVLSSEAGAGGAVTYDAFRRELRRKCYSILVYLGHGDLQEVGLKGLPPIGVLQFEVEGSTFANPIRADQLRSELQNHPVPVVVLAGCLTAASDAVLRRLPQWMRGNQSVAAALAYGDSGVQCAIGMRTRLETADAICFLKAFFQSLLAEAPGDVERAVRAGREDLFAQKAYPPSWSAPVIYRTSNEEPLFDWRSTRVSGLCDPLDDYEQKLRQEGWKALVRIPDCAPPRSREFPNALLARVESAFIDRWKERGAAVLWPARIDMQPDGTARAHIHHEGALEVRSLEGQLTFPSTLTVRTVEPSPTLKAAGFRAYFATDQPGTLRFLLRCPRGAKIAPGPLFEVVLGIPTAASAVYSLVVDNLESDPRAPLRGWSNAVVVPLLGGEGGMTNAGL
ncbi:CHAT domain-containing protein [Polyangium mundeleinium]|uniref:CHAT domain-containing protein n=1 Tax=Polyangium mundeleinium TaxID=2995306 RepID=A0ABT5ESS0_9BACT|nr:CHAT domain-containing protein [Polyangium mundeleinium]MDC0744801.1 CHAT domain-containing protein [Polyangium mundeleinium]